MLLSPIGSPTKTLAHLCLPPLVHDVIDRLDVDIVVYRMSAPEEEIEHVTPTQPEPELRLPTELVLLIAGHAARTSRRAALAFCLVSKWTRDVALPWLYTTLILQSDSPDDARSPFRSDDPALPPLSPTVSVQKPLLDRFSIVRHLWADVPQELAPKNLDAFPSLRQLAIHVDASEAVCNALRWAPSSDCCPGNSTHICKFADYPPIPSLTVLGQSHPQRWTAFTTSSQGRAFLRQVTHLRLLNICLSHYIPLEYISNLTHLCIPFFDLRPKENQEFTGLDYILAQPHLKMVVLTLNPRYWRFEEMSLKRWALLAMARDERLYVVASSRVDATRDWDDPRRDWEGEATGGLSIWQKAVQIRHKFIARLSRSYECE